MAYSELQRRQDALARNRENRGRMASVAAAFHSTGIGTVEHDARVDFGMIFIEEPRPSYGSMIDADDLRNLADADDDDMLPMPLCSGSVTEWDRDANGYYVGAWVATRVWTEVVDDWVNDLYVKHYFTFLGVALKLIPSDDQDN